MYKEDLNFCLDLWEKQKGCKFGGGTKCEDCAVPYLLWKLISNEILHEKLSLNQWKEKLEIL